MTHLNELSQEIDTLGRDSSSLLPLIRRLLVQHAGKLEEVEAAQRYIFNLLRVDQAAHYFLELCEIHRGMR